jgi:hypothetical protein
MLADIQAAMRAIEDARRTVLCTPDMEARVQTVVDSFGWGGLVHVRTSPHVPEGTAYIIDAPSKSIRKIVGIGDTP